jgi:hypothetical protein
MIILFMYMDYYNTDFQRQSLFMIPGVGSHKIDYLF